MEFRELGKTGEKISAIGMGTWKVGSATSPSARDEEIRAIKRGLELGINLIDTAEMYGDGKAEQLLREAIRGKRDSVLIATKVSPAHLRHDDVIAACDRSLARLGTDHVDLYQVHWPNPSIPIKDTMKAMEELVHAGKVRYVGVSNFNVRETKDAQEALGNVELASNQVEYSLTNRLIERDLLPYCEEQRITVIAYRPLAYGVIPTRSLPKEILDRHHLTAAQLMLNWVTRRPAVVAIPKSAIVKHTEENAASLSVKLSDEEYREVSESVR